MPETSSLIARFFGYALMAVGVLIALLSGACTLWVLTLMISQPHGDPGMVSLGLVVGVVFFAIGIGFVVGGRAVARSGTRKEPPDKVF